MAQQPASNPVYYSAGGPQMGPPPSYGAAPQGPSMNPPTQTYVAAQGPVDPGHVVIVQQPPGVQNVVVTAPSYGPNPQTMTCPYCFAHITTSITYRLGGLVWLVFVLLVIFGCILFSWLPCCIKSCKDVIHKCPSCNRVLGVYKRI